MSPTAAQMSILRLGETLGVEVSSLTEFARAARDGQLWLGHDPGARRIVVGFAPSEDPAHRDRVAISLGALAEAGPVYRQLERAMRALGGEQAGRATIAVSLAPADPGPLVSLELAGPLRLADAVGWWAHYADASAGVRRRLRAAAETLGRDAVDSCVLTGLAPVLLRLDLWFAGATPGGRQALLAKTEVLAALVGLDRVEVAVVRAVGSALRSAPRLEVGLRASEDELFPTLCVRAHEVSAERAAELASLLDSEPAAARRRAIGARCPRAEAPMQVVVQVSAGQRPRLTEVAGPL